MIINKFLFNNLYPPCFSPRFYYLLIYVSQFKSFVEEWNVYVYIYTFVISLIIKSLIFDLLNSIQLKRYRIFLKALNPILKGNELKFKRHQYDVTITLPYLYMQIGQGPREHWGLCLPFWSPLAWLHKHHL